MKKIIIWIPIGLMLFIAGIRIFYWEGIKEGHGHAGGGFGPFCTPMFKHILITKISINDELFLYKSSLKNPIKNIMLPQKNVIDEIGKRILEKNKYKLKFYPIPYGDLTGEIVTDEKGFYSLLSADSDSNSTIIDKEEIDFVQLDLWELDDRKNMIKEKTEYSLRNSYRYTKEYGSLTNPVK